MIPQIYKEKLDQGRHRELIDFSVSGAVEQAKNCKRYCWKVLIYINILWEMAAAEEILTRTLEEAGDIIDGVTCGAGMPYKLSDITLDLDILLSNCFLR